MTIAKFRSVEEHFEPICTYITKEECSKASLKASEPPTICDRIHFRPLIRPHTDPSLGHCSYLNTCYSEPTYAQSPSIPPYPGSVSVRGPVSLPSGLGAGGRGKEKAPCRYLHFEVDWDEGDGERYQIINGKSKEIIKRKPHRVEIGLGPPGSYSRTVRDKYLLSSLHHTHGFTLLLQLPPQWINCDLRRFDYSVLGKFHVIMADPPWDIHMSVRTYHTSID